jgi:transcriptional pleiotropic regulator of transition state genes
MKATGMMRKVDELGRIVIPKEMRDTMGITQGNSLEIFVEGENIVFRKYEPGCCICGNMESLKLYAGKAFCPECAKKIAGMHNYG